MNTLKKLSIIAMGGVLFGACKDEAPEPSTTDTTKPVISTLAVENQDHNITFKAGNTYNITYSFTDDTELGEARLDVHSNFDKHSHKKGDFEAFSWEKIIELSATESSGSIEIEVPANAISGAYHFEGIITDAAGNQSEYSLFDFWVTNAGQASINISKPADLDHIHVHGGESFNLVGVISDDEGIDHVDIIISEEEDHNHEHDHEHGDEPLFEKEIEVGAPTYNLDETIALPADTEAGHYELKIIVKDSDGNFSFVEGEIYVE